MPSSRQILDALARIANDWQEIAIAWHAALGILLIALMLGWRPRNRLAGVLLVGPLISVSGLAWRTGNPFNGSLFAAAVVALVVMALRFPPAPVRIGPPWVAISGIFLIAFGWVYPHFLETDSWTDYLYAAPLGLVPCPSLSATLGITLLLDGLDSRAWSFLLAAAGILYGFFGAFGLGVRIDLVLLAGAVMLALATRHLPSSDQS
jgi:hypothetical protein